MHNWGTSRTELAPISVMDTRVCFLRCYSFTVIAGLLVLLFAVFGPPCNADQNLFILQWEDFAIPEQVEKTMSALAPFNTPDPYSLTPSILASHVAAAQSLYTSSQFFQSPVFINLSKAFKQFREDTFEIYGPKMEFHIFTTGPILAPTKLATVAHICGITMSSIATEGPAIKFNCATNKYSNLTMVMMSFFTWFSDVPRPNVLANVASDATKTIGYNEWESIYKSGAQGHNIMRRLAYSYYVDDQAQKMTAPGYVGVYTLCQVPNELINYLTQGTYTGYTQSLVYPKASPGSFPTVDLTALPLVQSSAGTFTMVRNNKISTASFSVTLDAPTVKMNDDAATEVVTNLLIAAAAYLKNKAGVQPTHTISVPVPPTPPKPSQSEAVRNARREVLGLCAIFVGILTSHWLV